MSTTAAAVNDQSYMREKPVFPLLLSMALPMVISMLVNSLYNIVDSYFVARISEDAMTALSLVFPLQNFMSAAAIGFGIGINTTMSIRLGMQQVKKASQAASTGLIFSVIHGILLMGLGLFCMSSFLDAFHATDSVKALGLQYSNIVFLFSVIVNIGISYEKIFQAVGKMNVSMISMLIGCIANIILDPVLIFGWGFFPEMGIQGAALATGIGQTLTLLSYLVIYFVRPISVHVSVRNVHFDRELVKNLYSVGIPATLNLALPSLLISALNLILSAFAPVYILILGIYYKLQTFLYLTANGIVQGMRPLIGYNYGAGESGRVNRIFRCVLLLVAGIMAVGVGLSLCAAEQILALFTTQETTVEAGAAALRIICLGFLPSALSVTTSGALEGIGKGLPSLLISASRYILFILPAAWICSRIFHVSGVWMAFPIAEILTAILAFFIYRGSLKTGGSSISEDSAA